MTKNLTILTEILTNFDKEPDQPERKLDKFISLKGKRMILQQPVSYPARSTTDAETEEDKEENETHQDQEEVNMENRRRSDTTDSRIRRRHRQRLHQQHGESLMV